MYKNNNVDTDKVLKALEEIKFELAREHTDAIKEIDRYYEGVERGLKLAKEFFYCSNYEKDGETND